MWPWAVLLVAACAVLGLLLSTIFEGATVTVSAKSAVIPVPQKLLAEPNGPTGTLPYQTLTATQSASTSVAQSGTQHVSRAATGVVVIYNTYSAAPQPLVANTRLITADKKIYRIKTAITVPGAAKKTDGTLTPGSATVSVYADQPGTAYNTPDNTQMHIAGFAGDPRYDKFVVQSQGPISGGFVGDEAAIAPDDLTTAQNTLKRQLDESIRSIATSQVPSGFMAVNGSLGISYTDIAQAPGPDNTVILTQGVSATLVLIRESDLAVALAKAAVNGYAGDPVDLADVSVVDLSLGQSAASSTGPLNLVVGGSPTLVWQLDAAALKQALLGQKKSDFSTILQPFGNALQCDKSHPCTASIRPFWKATFPKDPNKLTLSVVH